MMMTSCQSIVMSWSYFWVMANLEQARSQIPGIVCKTYIAINSNVLSYKKSKRNTTFTLLHWVKVLILPKNADFFAKKTQKNSESRCIKSFIFWKNMCECTYVPNLKFLE